MTPAEELTREYGATGFSAEGHMMELFRETGGPRGFPPSRELEARNGERMRIAGQVVIRQQPPTAKGFCLSPWRTWNLMNVIVKPQVFRPAPVDRRLGAGRGGHH